MFNDSIPEYCTGTQLSRCFPPPWTVELASWCGTRIIFAAFDRGARGWLRPSTITVRKITNQASSLRKKLITTVALRARSGLRKTGARAQSVQRAFHLTRPFREKGGSLVRVAIIAKPCTSCGQWFTTRLRRPAALLTFLARQGVASLRELREWCYPSQERRHWHQTNIYRALRKLGAKRIGWGMYAL